MSAPVVLQPGAGAPIPAPAGSWTFKASSASLTVLEFLCAPGTGPALHRHLHEDELWYVADGDFLFQAGDVRAETSTGGLALGPQGLPHAFHNLGTEPGRLLVVVTSGGFGDFMTAVASAMGDGNLSPADLKAVGERFGIDFVGPRLVG